MTTDVPAADAGQYRYCSVCGQSLVPFRGTDFDRATGKAIPIKGVTCPQDHEAFVFVGDPAEVELREDAAETT